jgi:hypothetical protein
MQEKIQLGNFGNIYSTYDEVSKLTPLELHDALYAAQLTYVDTLKAFRQGLQKFRNNTWELVS